jgi:uncharacterized membrane-anchored protein YjiN (DUF445 family)
MRTKWLATISLLVMASGFALTLFVPETVFLRILSGGFEAGLVGGLADWFAVSALFRHPLGIPIPHTSLLLKNRGRIIESLISAMETELLNKDSIKQKLAGVPLLKGTASFVVKQAAKRKVRTELLRGAGSLLLQVPTEPLARSLQQSLAAAVRRTDPLPLMNQAAEAVILAKWDTRALDYAVSEGLAWVNKPQTAQMLGRIAHSKLKELQVGGFMGLAVSAMTGMLTEDKLGDMLQGMARSALMDLGNPLSPERENLLTQLRIKLLETAHNEELSESLRQAAHNKLAQEDTFLFINRQLIALRQTVLDKLAAEQAAGGPIIIRLLRLALARLNSMPETTTAWERGIQGFLVDTVEANHYRIGNLVRDNLNKLDDQSLVAMLEEKIGSDLQWIRLNGALCGFLVGIVLTLFRL